MSLHFERTFSSTEMPYDIHESVYTMSAPETCHVRCISNCKIVAVGVPKTDAANAKVQRGALAAMVVMQQ